MKRNFSTWVWSLMVAFAACGPKAPDQKGALVVNVDITNKNDTEIITVEKVSFFEVKSRTPASIRLSWSYASSTAIDHFLLKRNEGTPITIDPSQREYLDQDAALQVGQTYTYEISAVKGEVKSQVMLLSGVEVPAVAPASNLRQTNVVGKNVSIAWDDNGSGAFQEDGFVVVKVGANGALATIASLPANTTSYTLLNLDYGVHQFQIKSMKNLSFIFSNTLTVTLEAPPLPNAPAAPTGFTVNTVIEGGKKCFVFAWQDKSNNEVSWEFVYTSEDHSETNDYDGNVTSSSTSTSETLKSVNSTPMEMTTMGAREYKDCNPPAEFNEASNFSSSSSTIISVDLRAKNAVGLSNVAHVKI